MQDDNNPQAGWVYTPGGDAPGSSQPETTDNQYDVPQTQVEQKPAAPKGSKVSWSASEYIANPKNAGWFLALLGSSVLLAVIVYFITDDAVSTVVIALLGIIVGIFAARKPQVLEYHIDEKGFHMGNKFYPFTDFKFFSVAKEGAFSFISLMPLRRFMPPIAVHFSPEDEQKIVSTLTDYLPFEQHKRDILDSVSHRLRF